MKFCADASFVLRLYDIGTQPDEAETIRDYLYDDEKVLTISELCRIEVLNVLRRRPEISAAARFDGDVAENLLLRLESVDWPDTFLKAEALGRRFSRILRPGSHDLLLVAAAVGLG